MIGIVYIEYCKQNGIIPLLSNHNDDDNVIIEIDDDDSYDECEDTEDDNDNDNGNEELMKQQTVKESNNNVDININNEYISDRKHKKMHLLNEILDISNHYAIN